MSFNEARVTGFTTLGKALAVAATINDDGEQHGLQPYEIRHLLDAVVAERIAMNRALRNMPYLAGMGFGGSPSENAERAVVVLKAAAERNNEIETAYTALRNDVAALRRLLGS